MKTNFKRKLTVFCKALLIGIVAGLLGVVSISTNASTALPEGGRSFSADDNLSAVKRLDVQPKTYEALFYAPSDVSRPGILFGNAYDSSAPSLNFEIYTNGAPSLILRDCDGNQYSGCFDVDVRTNDWVHLVITHEITDAGSTFKCYVNGALVDTLSSELSFEYDMKKLQANHFFSLGKDDRTSTSRHFRGKIKNVALYSNVLTADEIKTSYEQGISTENENLIAYYQLDNTDGATFIKDSSGNGYDLQAEIQPNQAPLTPSDYDYSFAIIGDTQNQVRPDVYQGTNYTDYIYDWIVANKDSKKIGYVIGLGDITDRDGKDQTPDDGIDQTNAEWRIAVKQHDKLTEAGIPYSIIRGNHDGIKINDYFAGNDNFNNQDICYFDANSLLNYYVRFVVGQEKYMVVCLDYDTTEDVLEWAGEAIEANPDYKVIITTHAYLTLESEIIDMFYSSARSATEVSGKSCNGNQIWTELASQYKNVIMVLSGHVSSHDIKMREDVGVHGNTVYQFLIDPQGMDNYYKHKTSMVAMFYFSNGGKTVNVEYVSTYHTIENNDGQDYILNARDNQFAFNISEYQEVLPVECEYGTIDAKYASVTTYPFVVFKTDKTFIGGYGELSDAIAAVAADGNTDDYVIYMRRNAELRDRTVNLADFTGTITVDLGGHTLLKAQDGSVFSINVEDNSAATVDENGFDVGGTFVIANGTVWKYGTNPIVSVNYGTKLLNNYKAFFEFDGITFVNKNGASCNILATKEDGGANGTAACVYPYAVFNNCTFDYTNSIENTNMISLNSGDGYNRVVWNVTVNGGIIESTEGLSFSSFATLDSGTDGRNDILVFAKGEDDEFIKMRLPVSLEDPLTVFVSSEGNFRFVKNNEDAEYAIYVLEAFDGLLTQYGVVPAEYLDTTLYPILLFQNGKFINGFANFCTKSSGSTSDAIHAAKNRVDGNSASEIGGCVQMLFRADVTAKVKYNNICQSQGTIVIDLNGHKLIQAYSGTTFVSQIKYYNGFGDATIECRNGEMVLNGELLRFDCYGDAYNQYTTDTEYKTLHMNFDNVKFTYAKNAPATAFLGMFNEHSSTVDGKKGGYNVSFNDCVFDFTNAASMVTIMNANDPDPTKTNSIVNVCVNGGEIIGTKPMNALYEVNTANGSSVVFGVGSDGKYLKMTVVGSDEAPTATANNGALEFVKEGSTDSEGRTTYVLTPAPVRTPYGEIPCEYSDAQKYPVVVFQNGKFDSAHSVLSSKTESQCALGRAKSLTASTPGLKAEILVRNNITVSDTLSNQGQIQGEVLIDLSGYTMTQSETYMFSGIAKNWMGIHDSSFTVINGNIVLNTYGFVYMGASGSKYSDVANSTTGVYKTTSFIFKNVHISLAKGATVKNLLGSYYEGTSITIDGCIAGFEYIFDADCVIDVSNAPAGFTLFGANDDKISGSISSTAYATNCIVNVTVEGGKIIAANSEFTLAEVNESNTSSVKFGLGANGKYTMLSIPENATSPDMNNIYTTANGVECIFVKVSENDGYVNYSLYPKAMLGYKIKTSVTLWSNFVYNVYIPKTNLNSFTINGATMAYEEIEIDGVTYYHVAVNLPAGETLQDIKVCIKLNSGTTTVDANWTLNVLNYTKSVINGSYDDTTKTLMKDMLVYANAAYTYFGNTLEEEKAAEVATLLEGYTKEMPEGEAKKPTDKTYFTDVAVYLGEVPSFRFTLADGYTADDFTFKVGSRSATVITGDGYVEIVMYAYMMLDDVTFTVNGTDVTESYNLYAYYEYVKTLNNANLTAIVEALMKYSVSAKAYRESVIN